MVDIEKLKQLANKQNELQHNFICNDPEQKLQVDYWNATTPENILYLIEKIEELRELIKWKDEALEDFVISTEEELSHQPDWKQLLEALALKEKV